MAGCKRYLQYNSRAAAKGMAASLRRRGYFVQTRKSRSRTYGTTWTVYTCGKGESLGSYRRRRRRRR